ncbi:helix-turn-helix domain-containing protein [Pseudogulbenkiania sp. MAI-1]|uniref:helix-turn-helix domain-containing protein n=1 Tax=Pseudogulbenkiania sp. MAI-1 TaxID=990370 RepID=UPI00045E8E99|nr:helix-turn-helix transcriptional regulator [Pseudogulbenkiania sp. MAI-1]
MSNSDVDQLAKTVGKAIARHRQARNLTQEEVAELLGIGNEAVSRMERGLVMPTVARLVELAQVFQCEAADLLTEVSTRAVDQAKYLERLLSRLDNQDRAMVVAMVETLTGRLAQR